MTGRKRRAVIPVEATEAEPFGQRLSRLRKARGFTQTELGEILGVSQRVITYYERESGKPPAHLLPRLADALKGTGDEIVGSRSRTAPASAGEAHRISAGQPRTVRRGGSTCLVAVNRRPGPAASTKRGPNTSQ